MNTDLKFFSGIRDSIHGLILFTKIEGEIINTKYMDRLRHIKNSSLAYRIYPSHTVTRFTHSLGVMHIAGQMAKAAIKRYLRLVKKREVWREEITDVYSVEQVLQIVRLAALLHDVGHGPFSHSSESTMLKILSKHYKQDLNEMLRLRIDAVHEYYSYKIITGKTEIREILEENGIDPLDVAGLLTKESNETTPRGFHSPGLKLLRRIISSQIDADRLDNLLRDSHGVGVPYGLVDVDNIVNNIYIYRQKGELDIAFHIRALDSIEHMLDSRYKMYLWIYLHRINVLYDAILVETLSRMLDDEFLSYRYLYWDSLAREWGDYTDDKYILQLISKALSEQPERYWISSSVFNQNILPIPIWRSFEDFITLMDVDINRGTQLLDMLVEKYKSEKTEFLDSVRNGVKNRVNEDLELLIGVKEMPPAYKWEERDVKILTGPNLYHNLRDISIYIKRLYEMGKIYKPFYIYYYLRGKERSQYSKLYKHIRNVIKDIVMQALDEKLG